MKSWQLMLSAGAGFLTTGIYHLIISNYFASIPFLLTGIVFVVSGRGKYKTDKNA